MNNTEYRDNPKSPFTTVTTAAFVDARNLSPLHKIRNKQVKQPDNQQLLDSMLKGLGEIGGGRQV